MYGYAEETVSLLKVMRPPRKLAMKDFVRLA